MPAFNSYCFGFRLAPIWAEAAVPNSRCRLSADVGVKEEEARAHDNWQLILPDEISNASLSLRSFGGGERKISAAVRKIPTPLFSPFGIEAFLLLVSIKVTLVEFFGFFFFSFFLLHFSAIVRIELGVDDPVSYGESDMNALVCTPEFTELLESWCPLAGGACDLGGFWEIREDLGMWVEFGGFVWIRFDSWEQFGNTEIIRSVDGDHWVDDFGVGANASDWDLVSSKFGGIFFFIILRGCWRYSSI